MKDAAKAFGDVMMEGNVYEIKVEAIMCGGEKFYVLKNEAIKKITDDN